MILLTFHMMAHKYINSCFKLISQTTLFNQPIKNNIKCLNPYSDYRVAKKLDEIKPSVLNYDVSRSKEEWECVERLLPPKIVPKPIPRESYKTFWRPQMAVPGAEKYFVERNRNYMIPIHFETTHRGTRKITSIKNIRGDIHELNKDLKKLIEKKTANVVATQINELVGVINIKGDHYRIVLDFLQSKGF